MAKGADPAAHRRGAGPRGVAAEDRRMRGKSRGKGDATRANPKPDPTAEAAADTLALARQMGEIAEKSRQLVSEFLQRQSPAEGIGTASPAAIGTAFFEMTARLMSDPSRLVQAQLSLWHDYMTLWQRTAQRFLGDPVEPVIEAAPGD